MAKLTPGRQLAQERAATIRHIRRIAKKGVIDDERLIAWIQARDERYNKRPRGLGK